MFSQFVVRCLIFAALTAALPVASAVALEVEGVDFPATSMANGTAVQLVGAGVRSKWMVNVYAMAVYCATVKKTNAHITNADEAKLIWISMLRGIGAQKMRDAIEDGIAENVPPNEKAKLQPDLDKLKATLQGELHKGLVIQFAYTPARGTVVKIGNAEKLTIPGRRS